MDDGRADVTIGQGNEPLSTAMHLFHGPEEAFCYVRKTFQDNFEAVPDYTLAWQCGRCYGLLPTAYARAAFDKSPISPERACHVDEDTGTRRTLLHAAAANLADSVVVPFDASDTLQILKRVLDVTTDLHPRDSHGATPLDYLCYGTHGSEEFYEEDELKVAVLQ